MRDRASGIFLVAAALLFPSPVRSQVGSDDDIDPFMEKVLAKREVNWEALHNYAFKEREVLRVSGSDIAALESFENEYEWFEQDGAIVKSPVKLGGVRLDDARRETEAKKWDSDEEKLPWVVQRGGFYGFPFEPGNYYFAGREELDGREVVVIEYYPEKLFDEEEKENENGGEELEEKRGNERDPRAEEIQRMLNRTSLVTMHIDPEEHQIVKLTFANVGLDFLPARFLVQVSGVKASVTMGQPLGDSWLPTAIAVSGRVATAAGAISIAYGRDFTDYVKTSVRMDFSFGPRGKKKPR